MPPMDANEIGLIALPGGPFLMGSDADRRDERPAHAVVVAAFLVARRPVSNAQYARYVEAAGVAPPPFWAQEGFCGADQPVVGVSWHDAVGFCAWLSEQGETRFRLPTEAEREFAARGGIEAAAWPEIDDAWPDAEVRRAVALAEQPHAPLDACLNGFGLFCMADNVHEWCSDWYDRSWYERSPSAAPTGPESGQRRASRGGSWRHRVKFTRVSARSSLPPSYRYNDYGFRVYADPAPRAHRTMQEN